jgi:DnaJ-class molecular chaperone
MEKCKQCSGNGIIDGAECSSCGGSGVEFDKESFDTMLTSTDRTTHSLQFRMQCVKSILGNAVSALGTHPKLMNTIEVDSVVQLICGLETGRGIDLVTATQISTLVALRFATASEVAVTRLLDPVSKESVDDPLEI